VIVSIGGWTDVARKPTGALTAAAGKSTAGSTAAGSSTKGAAAPFSYFAERAIYEENTGCS
jgi:hypothetical protein